MIPGIRHSVTDGAPDSPLQRVAATAALLLYFSLLGLAIRWSDLSVPGHALRFVPCLLAASAAFFWSAHTLRGRLFWPVAIGLRVLVLPMAPGDDVWRYLWEGRLQWLGYNPYLLAPDAPALIGLRDAVWQAMNHHGYAAVYPPGAELVFRLLTIGGGAVLGMKIVFALADLAILALLEKMHPSRADLVWVGWNPLVVYSFAGGAHYDSLMILTILLAVFCLGRVQDGRPRATGWALAAGSALGLAISLKSVPVVLLPMFALRLGRRWPALIPAAAIPAGLALCYGFPEHFIFRSFLDFSRVARFNDAVWWISESLLWANPGQQNGIYNPLALGVALFLGWRMGRTDERRGVLWALGAVLLLSPMVHPWYLTWILPFAVLQRVRAWFVLAATMFLAFLWWETTPWWTAWTPSPLLSLAIYLPPLVFAGIWHYQNRPSIHP